jgi:hypothetical protein
VHDGWVTEEGAVSWVDLTGQEFLAFRGLRSEADVAAFARTHGLLDLGRLAREVVGGLSNLRPGWARALVMAPDRYGAGAEPVADWLRQAGLMDLAVGLWGMYLSPPARRALLAACRRLRRGREGTLLARQAEVAGASSSWAVRSVLGGAARAGLGWAGTGATWSGDGRPRDYVEFRGDSWRPVRRAGRVILFRLRFELTPGGIAEALTMRLVNPFQERVRASLVADDGDIVAGYRLPRDLLGLLWNQLANAVLSAPGPRVCAWERCPGPPERPGVFVWRWGRTPTGTKHRDAVYCHPRCQHAAAVDRSRRSPGAQLRRRRR